MLVADQWMTIIVSHKVINTAKHSRFGFSNIATGVYTYYINDLRAYKAADLDIEYTPLPVYTSINLSTFKRTMERDEALTEENDNLSWTNVTETFGAETGYKQVYKHQTTAGIPTWTIDLKHWKDMVQITDFKPLMDANKYLVFNFFVPDDMPAAELKLYMGTNISHLTESSVFANVTVIDSSGNQIAALKKGEWLTIIIDMTGLDSGTSANLRFTTRPETRTSRQIRTQCYLPM